MTFKRAILVFALLPLLAWADIPAVGSLAPDFTLPDQGGVVHKLSEWRGKWLVLYFYPKDDTSGCTAEACDFRDNLAKFNKAKAVVIGISKDSPMSHDNFKAKQGLTFTLASDEDGRVCQRYGVWIEKSLYGRKYMGIDRATFIVDPMGKVVRAWRRVKVPGHVDQVLARALIAPLTPIDWSEADDLAAQPPSGLVADMDLPVRH